jgi:Ca2+-binding EF-hand superfamily protein
MVAMRSLGHDTSFEEARKLIQKVDRDGSEEIGFEEFLELMGAALGAKESEEEIDEVFAHIVGRGKDGFIGPQHLKKLFEEMGATDVTDLDIIDMLNEADREGDMEVTLKEFKNMMRKAGLF